MRPAFILAALLAFFASSPAAAAWQNYRNETLGYAVVFPTAPVEATGNYKSDLIPGAPTSYATAHDGGGTFLSLVVDTGRREDGAIIMGEFEYWLSHLGDVVVNTTVRLNVGMEYGRYLTIDCHDQVVSEGPLQVERAKRLLREAANFSCPTGARLAANLFFSQGCLYFIAAVAAGEDAKASGAPVRFTNSLEWIGKNAEYGRGLIARSSLAGRAPVPRPAVAPAAGN